MKRFIYILPIVFLLAGCQKAEEELPVIEEDTTEEVSVLEIEEETETTTEEVVVKKDSMDEEKLGTFKDLNFSTTPANFVVNEQAQYAIAYDRNVLTSIHPVTSGRDNIEDYDEFSLQVDKGYIYVTPTIDFKTSNYIKIDGIMVNIPNESVVYFSEPREIVFKGIRVQSINKEGFLSVPVYTIDGIMHNDGFDTTKYTKAALSIPTIYIVDANTFNPLIFDLIEPEDLQVGFEGSITVTYSKDEDKTFYLYNDSVHSDTGSNYTLYKDDEKIYKGHLPGGCRMYVDFKNYDKIEICCGLLVPTQ